MRFTGPHPSIQRLPELGNRRFIQMSLVRINLQLCDVPVFDFLVKRIIRPGDIESFHYETLVLLRQHRNCSPRWKSSRGSLHLYGLNCHACPVVNTHITRSLIPHQNLILHTKGKTSHSPRIRSKLVQRLDPIHHKILDLRLCLSSSWLDVRSLSINYDYVLS